MPQIPEFVNTMDVPLPRPPRADPGAMAAPGQALARGGADESDVLSQILNTQSAQAREFDQRRYEARRAVASSDAMVAAQQQLGDAAQKWSTVPDRTAAQVGFNADAGKIRDSILGKIDDPEVQSLVAQHFGAAQIVQNAAVGRDAFRQEAANEVGKLDFNLDDLSHRYADAANDIERAQITDTAKQAILSRSAGGYITGEQAAHLQLSWLGRADEADAIRDVDADPKGALDRLNDDSNYSHLDELARSRLLGQAENKVNEQQATLRGVLRDRFNDNLASLSRSGAPAVPLSDSQIRAAFPDTADDMLRQLTLAQGLYRATQSIGLTSPQEDHALLSTWNPKGAGFADQAQSQDALEKALSLKYQAIAKGPAAYVLNVSPTVSAAFAQAQSDPSKFKTAISMLDAAYDRLGVPPQSRTVLTADSARQIAASIADNPELAPTKLKALQAQIGPDWPRVWHDVTTIGKLPAMFQAVPVLDNERDGALLARWIAQAPKGKTAGEILGARTENDIKTSVRSDPGVQSLLSSLSHSGSSVDQVNGVLEAIDGLAFAKSLFDRDPRAAQNAISAFTSKYEFMPNGGARVPTDRFSDVQTNASATLSGLTPDNVQVPTIYGKPGAPRPDEFLSLLKSSPMWITAPSSQALWLMDPYGRVVRDKAGAPISVPFNMPAQKSGGADAAWSRVLGAFGYGGR